MNAGFEAKTPPRSIDEVIERLTEVMDWARASKNRLGFFAALYRQVTIKIREGITKGGFEDGARMEQMDVVFANRYLEALNIYLRGRKPPRSWLVAFETASKWRPIIIQHLLLGINAHINLDLGAAAAVTNPGTRLPALKRDFDTINAILHELLDSNQERIAKASPWMAILDRVGGRSDEAVVNFSVMKARDAAWRTAQRLASLGPGEMEAELDRVDQVVEHLARAIRTPGVVLTAANLIVRLKESSDIPGVIDLLA